jgi:TolB protein
MRLPVSGIVLLAAAASLAGCGGGGSGSDIAFVSTRDGDYAIFAMKADGDRQHRLTSRDAVDVSSPQGLFFQVEPAWSPDGTKIAFASRRAGTFDIYVMNPDGTGTERLTSGKSVDNHPAYSPDGKRIAFVRDADIYVMNADGSGARRLTRALAEEADTAWSPDGTWIAYTRRMPGSSVREIWLVRPDGSEPHPITSFGQTIYGPAWSPGSKRIAFAGDLDGTTYDIYSVDVQGKSRKRYTQSHSDAFEPAWSPDGQTIAFSRDGAIELIAADGSISTLTDPEDNDTSPAWNPVTADEED